MKYNTCRILDGKPRKVIVDENGKVINRNPSKDELKGLEKELRTFRDTIKYETIYTDEELLNCLRQFEKENGRVPIRDDFRSHPIYPSYMTYVVRFGSWSKALKLVGLDVESMVKKGVIETNDQKARLAEMTIRDQFKEHPIDLAGENKNSPCDGICPNGMYYDVKSSKLYIKSKNCGAHWIFGINNKYKEYIEIYYLLAFSEDYSKLKYGWRIPGEITEKDYFIVWLTYGEFTVDNMKEYDITDKLKEIINIGI